MRTTERSVRDRFKKERMTETEQLGRHVRAVLRQEKVIPKGPMHGLFLTAETTKNCLYGVPLPKEKSG